MATKSKAKGKSRLPIFPIIVVVALVALAAVAWMSNKKASSTFVYTSSAPVTTPSVSQSLEALRGKVVILNIWATWCGPCRVEIPDFIKLQEKYRSEGLEIVGASVDPIDARGGGGAAAVAPFVQKNGINYSIWMVDTPAALSSYPMGSGIPTTYVIDRDGRTIQKYVGVQPMSRFETDIKALL